MPPSQETGLQRSPILGVPPIFAYTLCRTATKFEVVTRVAEERVSWRQPRLPCQESGVPAIINFWILVYFCLYPLTQNDQIRHGCTYGMAYF